MTDTKALLAKMMAVESGAQCGPGHPDFGGVTSWHRNPEGPEARALIEALLAERDGDADALKVADKALTEAWRRQGDAKSYQDLICATRMVRARISARKGEET